MTLNFYIHKHFTDVILNNSSSYSYSGLLCYSLHVKATKEKIDNDCSMDVEKFVMFDCKSPIKHGNWHQKGQEINNCIQK